VTAGESEQDVKLRLLLGRLQKGQHASNREMRKALGDDAYADFEGAWQTQKDLRAQLKNKPDAIREYEALLKAAIFAYSKADAASTSGRNNAARAGMQAADTAFEKLYERLGEMVDADSSLAGWFDREVRWDAANAPPLCPEGAPKVVTSKSQDNKGGGIAAGLRDKRDVKVATIEHKLDELAMSDDDKAAVAARLAKGLNRARLGKR